jgi:hypothetical protein
MWKKLSKKGKALVIGLASLVFLLLIFSLLPIMRVSYAVEEMYSDTETYYVQETYTEQEPYTVMEPYTEIEVYCAEEPCAEYIPIDYSVISGRGYNYFQADGSPGCSVEVFIQNNDVIGGTFTVEFLVKLKGNLTTTISGSNYIEAGNSKKVIAYYDAHLEALFSFTYTIAAPMKLNPTYTEVEVTKYRPVIEYGEVTKKRYIPQEVDVLHTRTVINYKRVSLFDYLINY